MKAFNVYLRDGRTATVYAETYRREGNQYVFEKTGSGETQFFVDSEVAGISEAITSRVPRAAQPGDGDRSLLAKAELEAIVRTLAECAGNRIHTARKLVISRRALLYKLKKLETGEPL